MAPLSKAAFNLIKRLGNFWIFLKHEMSYQRKGQILILITTSNCTSLKILPVFGQFCFRSIRTNLELTFISTSKHFILGAIWWKRSKYRRVIRFNVTTNLIFYFILALQNASRKAFLEMFQL